MRNKLLKQNARNTGAKTNGFVDEKKISAASMIIAFLALILSQFKPIYQYFESAEIELKLASHIQIGQSLGNLILMPFFQIKNSGSSHGYVRDIGFYIENTDLPNIQKKIPVQQYYLKPTTISAGQIPTRLPMGDISVATGEGWEAYIEIFDQPSPLILQEFSVIQAAVATELLPKNKTKISDELYGKISSIVSRNMSWFKEGKYRVLFVLREDPNDKPIIKQAYSFTVTTQDIELLNEVTNRFRYGEFIVNPPKTQNGFFSRLSLIHDSKDIDELYRRYLEL
ncbi:hypothetical protein C9J03_22245 [Photobacterium gaetbulicola]|uniref:Uncharacterized protein n=1 Tax=Photobacterium gaetbulicola Gung47 TaxID=658445 RepID=A0A0C5WZZ5_9GAMM|nr:hypothetical protein [Photobacterium gaetbulicola]AJR08640.1 hypothetical protein H744_2c1976 [Photobacterium gaetbulicola Gung47]PSU02918.1 hypothetical protein C9J03_22245 [Photobacterium gaetbulicola]